VIVYKPYDGPPINLTTLKKGDVFGWSAVVGSRFYTSGAISQSRIEAVRIRGSELWGLVNKHPDTGRVLLDRLARIVSSRWKNAHAQVQALLDEGFRKATRKGELI
jgi:CRP-like cAMP-binding protein